MTAHLPLGPGAEFDSIRSLLARWGPRAQGIGDDAAVVDVPQGTKLVVSTDGTVEGVHFRREWLTPEEIGWRGTMAALSDLAAMGATPLGVLVSFTVPTRWRDPLGLIAEGIGEAVARVGTTVVGGNLSGGDTFSLTLTVLGSAARPVGRGGARPGDRLWVSGNLGGPNAALRAWETGSSPSDTLRQRFARPEARLELGRWCADHGATAMIDLSDGLRAEAGHIAAASGVRCRLETNRLPVWSGASVEDALEGGEEYELLAALPSEVRAPPSLFGAAWSPIGEVVVGSGSEGGDLVILT